MDTNQPTNTIVVVQHNPGIFGSKIPSSVTFIVGILLFFLPFAEIKCGGQTIANKSGLDFAMAKDWKVAGKANMFGQNDLKEKTLNADKQDLGNTQYFAIGAAALALLGFLFSLGSAKSGIGGMLMGLLATGALVALMLETKKLFNDSLSKQALDKGQQGADGLGFDKIGDQMNNIASVSFTAWFYIAALAFLAGAIFSFLRTRSTPR